MPGIVGIISERLPDNCRHLVKLMVASMEYEPFYDSGTYAVPEMGIYGGWVAHETSFAADQVFLNAQENIALLFSGECFVDPEMHAEVTRRGHQVGEATGNWLVHLYEEEGDQFFAKMNGLFSALLIDKRQNKAFLFNDRYGIERIYWHESKDATYFASEAKALLRILPALRAFDEEGVTQFLTYGCTLEGRTLFRDVHLLPGASLWSFENGKCRKRKYFCPETWEAQPTLSVDSFESEFQETFKRILPRYFESGSKIGISLTGGLDTRMIMACRAKTKTPPVCYTFAGRKGNTLDARRAVQIAAACGLEHRVLRIGNDFLEGFGEFVDRTVYATDGCSGATGAHEIYFNRMARSLAPVRLTGNFGSEVLRGMSTFKPVHLVDALMAGGLQSAVAKAAEYIPASAPHPVPFAAFREIPWKLFGTLAAGRSQVTFRTPYLDNELVELAFRKPPGQHTSPLPALRFVSRNHPALGQIPTDRGQVGESRGLGWALRRVFAEVTFKLDYLHKEGLPDVLVPFDPMLNTLSHVGILGLHKFLQFRGWFRHELGPYLRDRLSDSRIIQNPFWNADFIRELPSRHIAGRKNYVAEINAVLTLDAVDRLLFRSP
jgi:asparagine synthase (glutamine-hydrolysing)